MKPFYWRGTTNFGDYINHWIWPKLIPDLLEPNDGVRLIGIGSLLKTELNYVKGKKIIFGTGSGYGDIPPAAAMQDWIFYFVRGPLTAQKFGLSPEKAIVDGAWLISQLPQFSTIPNKKGVSFVPHWISAEMGDWENVCAQADISYINPLGEFEKILQEIAKSELVITESLHGAILADYFRTPWIPVKISSKFLDFKWQDWCQSVSLKFERAELPPSDYIDCLYHKQNPCAISYDSSTHAHTTHENITTRECDKKPPLFYSTKGTIKSYLKQARKNLFMKLKGRRNILFFSAWNKTHRENLAKTLKKITLNRPMLSSSAVRSEKIEKLTIVLDQLITDYKNGLFFESESPDKLPSKPDSP